MRAKKVECFCDVCGKSAGYFPPSVPRRTCSRECYIKLNSGMVSGEGNPNYKTGKYCTENRCCDCGIKIDHRSKRCPKCRGANLPVPTRPKISEKTRLLMGVRSKEKFTREYLIFWI
jgi:hypothetical protein